MRITVIPSDGYIGVGTNDKDKLGFFKLDMTDLNQDIHAIQWYDTWGEVEWAGHAQPNSRIEDFSPYAFLLDRWEAKKNEPPKAPVGPFDV